LQSVAGSVLYWLVAVAEIAQALPAAEDMLGARRPVRT
jgi:hypothetical protein